MSFATNIDSRLFPRVQQRLCKNIFVASTSAALRWRSESRSAIALRGSGSKIISRQHGRIYGPDMCHKITWIYHQPLSECIMCLVFVVVVLAFYVFPRSGHNFINLGRQAGWLWGKAEHENKVHYLVPIILICVQITNTRAALTHTSTVIALQTWTFYFPPTREIGDDCLAEQLFIIFSRQCFSGSEIEPDWCGLTRRMPENSECWGGN